MVNSKRTVRTRKSSSEQQQQNALREFLQGQNVFVKCADCFNHCKCTPLYSAI